MGAGRGGAAHSEWACPCCCTLNAACCLPYLARLCGTAHSVPPGCTAPHRRLPDKAVFKSMFLDALGEPQDSPRRSSDTGLQAHYVLNAGQAGREIDVLLLDERYERDTLPCQVRGRGGRDRRVLLVRFMR